MIIPAILVSVLFLAVVVIPIKREVEAEQLQAFKEDLCLFKLKTVREHYPSLQDLEYDEIIRKYRVLEAYNGIHSNSRR